MRVPNVQLQLECVNAYNLEELNDKLTCLDVLGYVFPNA